MEGLSFFFQLLSLGLMVHVSCAQQQQPCQSLTTADEPNPDRCSVFPNCTGLQCDSSTDDFVGTTTVVFDTCQDPITAEVRLMGFVEVTKELAVSSVYEVPTAVTVNLDDDLGQLRVNLNRTSTQLSFDYSLLTQLSSTDLIPSLSLALNNTDCMCRSLVDLASLISTPEQIEHDCVETDQCTGIQCQLDVNNFLTFFIDLLILPCLDPPSMKLAVEDDARNTLYFGVFVRNESREIEIVGLRMTVHATVVQRKYSMVVEADLSVPLFFTEPLDIFPTHQIILDFSKCTTHTPVPPPPEASAVCQALYTTSIDTLISSSFTCKEPSSSSSSLECSSLVCAWHTLEGEFQLELTLLPCEQPKPAVGFHVVKGVTRGTGSDVFQIVVENEVVIAGSPPRNVSLENVDFMGGLVLTVELFEFEVRMYGVEVKSYFFDGVRNTHQVLIPFNMIPIDSTNCPTVATSKSSTLAIAVSISIVVVVLLLLVGTLVVVGVVFFLKQKKRLEPFDFARMSDLEGKEEAGTSTASAKKREEERRREKEKEAVMEEVGGRGKSVESDEVDLVGSKLAFEEDK